MCMARMKDMHLLKRYIPVLATISAYIQDTS